MNCCALILTETWLNLSIPDNVVSLEGLATFRADRSSALSGKTREGGLCIYINNNWCKNAMNVASYCSPDIKLLTVNCRPFYLPREFTVVSITAVYVPPSANTKEAMSVLYRTISELQSSHTEGVFIIAGDFNQANMKTVLPHFNQYVDFPTRGVNTLDLAYTNIKEAFRAAPGPHLGSSDHLSVMLIPAYKPLLIRTKPTVKQVRMWTEGAMEALQDCFECSEWEMFKAAATYNDQINIDEYAMTVSAYINKCTEDVSITKNIITRTNQKPWMTKEVREMLKAQNSAFKSGDKEALRTARANLNRAIRLAKRTHSRKIQEFFHDTSNTRSMWQGIKAITDYNPSSPPVGEVDADFLNGLNNFFGRLEALNSTPAKKTVPHQEEDPLCLDTADVLKTLKRVNPRKAPGPDNIPGRVFRECAGQLAGVLTDIFNTSLDQATVPACLKTASIIPVPKKPQVTSFNDYRPVALTPIMMKCFERLVKEHIVSRLPSTFDPFQFAYRRNRSTEDAISSALHLSLAHLEEKNTHVRMLFLDFSSAFNTIIPQHLAEQLGHLGFSTPLRNWLLDFLTDRPQSVRIGQHTSDVITLSTGSPQGCVLSPLLFTLMTHDCVPRFATNHIVKFADNTTVVGLIRDDNDLDYREEVEQLVDWCRDNSLILNVDKTKEMIVDFRKNRPSHAPLLINSSAVEVVSSTKFLGVHITNDLTWTVNTTSLVKRAQKRLYFLRRMRKAHLPPPILKTFYRSTIESILTSCLSVWCGGCSASDWKNVRRVVRTAERIIGAPLPSIQDISSQRCVSRGRNIVSDPSHPHHGLFSLLPSGKRFCSIRCRSTRFRNSFFPLAIRLLNS
uniref:Reverse transcriptase domain-containing protein n=1 Tax=Xiphophorus maculatus TaxID=8083 RepID=A0A3B5PZ90_XIPMA